MLVLILKSCEIKIQFLSAKLKFIIPIYLGYGAQMDFTTIEHFTFILILTIEVFHEYPDYLLFLGFY